MRQRSTTCFERCGALRAVSPWNELRRPPASQKGALVIGKLLEPRSAAPGWSAERACGRRRRRAPTRRPRDGAARRRSASKEFLGVSGFPSQALARRSATSSGSVPWLSRFATSSRVLVPEGVEVDRRRVQLAAAPAGPGSRAPVGPCHSRTIGASRARSATSPRGRGTSARPTGGRRGGPRAAVGAPRPRAAAGSPRRSSRWSRLSGRPCRRPRHDLLDGLRLGVVGDLSRDGLRKVANHLGQRPEVMPSPYGRQRPRATRSRRRRARRRTRPRGVTYRPPPCRGRSRSGTRGPRRRPRTLSSPSSCWARPTSGEPSPRGRSPPGRSPVSRTPADAARPPRIRARGRGSPRRGGSRRWRPPSSRRRGARLAPWRPAPGLLGLGDHVTSTHADPNAGTQAERPAELLTEAVDRLAQLDRGAPALEASSSCTRGRP